MSKRSKIAEQNYFSNLFRNAHISDLAKQAISERYWFNIGYEQAEKEMIEKAVKWLETHRDEYPFTWYNEMEGESGITDVCIQEFRKAMEE